MSRRWTKGELDDAALRLRLGAEAVVASLLELIDALTPDPDAEPEPVEDSDDDDALSQFATL